jgi:hypothetical protein
VNLDGVGHSRALSTLKGHATQKSQRKKHGGSALKFFHSNTMLISAGLCNLNLFISCRFFACRAEVLNFSKINLADNVFKILNLNFFALEYLLTRYFEIFDY